MHPHLLPPMNFQALMKGTELSADIMDPLIRLLELKSRSKEMCNGPREPLIDALILSELELATKINLPSEPGNARYQGIADDLFRAIVMETANV